MKVALLGRGKMGRMIESLEPKICSLEECDVAIDFSHPDAVLGHTKQVRAAGCDLVIGTTGWERDAKAVRQEVKEGGFGAIYSPNFSIGVQLFLQLLEQTNPLFSNYDAGCFEIHHSEKVDAPSGTGKAVMKRIGATSCRAVRVGAVAGTHTAIFDSPFDTIEITHRAKSREGFARGALEAAEWIVGKKGFYTLEDYLEERFR